MSSLVSDKSTKPARARGLLVGDKELAVFLSDGRRIIVPIAAFPRLARATAKQRQHFEVYGDGKMLHWPDIDEDIEVQHVVEGRHPKKAPSALLAS